MAKINIQKNEVQKVVEEILQQETIKRLSEEEGLNFLDLKNAANNFLLSIIDIYNAQINKTHKEKISERLFQIKSNIKSIYSEMRADTDFTRKILEIQHIFENQLNQYLQRTIYLTYVDEQGNLIAYDEAETGKIYTKATANFGRGNIGASILKDFIKTQEQNINLDLAKNVSKRQKVYLEAVNRWESNKNETNKEYNPSKNTFYWKKAKDKIIGWTGPISSRGVIAEGYAGAVINEDPDISNSKLEVSLKYLWEKHIQKDSIPAAIKGDIVLNSSNGAIQFAIKEGSFSTAKIGQYINLAHNIQKLSNETLKQDFYLALPKLLSTGRTSQKIVDILNQKTEDTAFLLIKEYLSSKSGKNAIKILKS